MSFKEATIPKIVKKDLSNKRVPPTDLKIYSTNRTLFLVILGREVDTGIPSPDYEVYSAPPPPPPQPVYYEPVPAPVPQGGLGTIRSLKPPPSPYSNSRMCPSPTSHGNRMVRHHDFKGIFFPSMTMHMPISHPHPPSGGPQLGVGQWEWR